MAKDRDGSPLRDQFDQFAIKATNAECVKWLLDRGIVVSEKVVSSHLTKHAPYVKVAREVGSKKIQKMIVKVRQEKVEASEALQRIIDIGDAKVREGSMPVTEKLYIEAIKEQGKRGVKTTIDTEFETLDEGFINKVKKLKDGQAT